MIKIVPETMTDSFKLLVQYSLYSTILIRMPIDVALSRNLSTHIDTANMQCIACTRSIGLKAKS